MSDAKALGDTLWLVGMMGVGKSVVGAKLAAALGRPFVDTDRMIEERAKMSIPSIFASEGEAVFRCMEREVIESLAGRAVVAALGGGAMAQKENTAAIARGGVAVCLRARSETLLRRLGEGEDRPLLAGLGSEERLARLDALLAERAPFYDRASVQIDTDVLAPDEVVNRVLAALAGARS